MGCARYLGVEVYSVFSEIFPERHFDGISYVCDSIVIGNEGLDDFLSENSGFDLDDLREGRFWLFYKKRNTYTACTDDCGQEAIFYYHVGNVWALSNSFLALVEHLSFHGVGLYLNHGAVASFFIPGGFGETLISDRTAVQEVKVLPRGSQIKICSGDFSVEARYATATSGVSAVLDFPDLDVLYSHMIKWRGRLRALVEQVCAYSFQVDVSGGTDSRMLLGLLLSSGADLSGIQFVSNPNLEQDYRVACGLADVYGFSLGRGVNRACVNERLSEAEQFEIYLYGCLGVYHKPYFPAFRERPNIFRLHGGGGEVLREYYSGDFLSFIERYEKFFKDPALFQLIRDNYASCLESGSYNSANDHYLDYRSRFHFGRNWYKSNTASLVTPLLSSDLIREYAALSPLAKSKRYLQLAYYLLLDPTLLNIPFDTPEKSFPAKDIERMQCHIAQWRPQTVGGAEEVQVFVGEDAERVAYSWGHGNRSKDEMLERELRKAEGSKFIGNYFAKISANYISSIRSEKDPRRRYRQASHVILLARLDALGVHMVA